MRLVNSWSSCAMVLGGVADDAKGVIRAKHSAKTIFFKGMSSLASVGTPGFKSGEV